MYIITILPIFFGLALGQPGCNPLTQIMCSGSGAGPASAMKCIPMYSWKRRNSGNNFCLNQCPMNCPPNMVQCPGSYYDSEGCETASPCMIAVKDCPTSMFDQKGCPINNNPEFTCAEGQVSCPPQYDDKGCQIPPTCSTAASLCPPSAFDEQGCPAQNSPVTCDANTMIPCSNGFDHKGCNMGMTCIAKESTCPPSSFDSQGCPVIPTTTETTCPEGMVPCSKPDPSNDCPRPTICQAAC